MNDVVVPPDIIIRSYRESDAATTLAVFERAIHETASADYTPQQRSAWARDDRTIPEWNSSRSNRPTWVAVDDQDRAVGFTDLETTPWEDVGHIDMMFVDPSVGRRGVATALIQTVFVEADRRGYRTLTVDGSLTARPFFESMGFTVVRQQSVGQAGELLTNFAMVRTTERT